MRRILCAILLLCAVFVVQFQASGQNDDIYAILKNSSHRTVTPLSISSYTVLAIAQDDRGMLWFGTMNGLYSFDNYTFTEYDWEGCKNETITSMLCVGDSLFIGTEDGLSIVNLKNKMSYDLLNDNKINCMCLVDDKNVMVGTNLGLVDYYTQNGTVINISDTLTEVKDIEYDSANNKLWIASESGLYSYGVDGIIHKINDVSTKTVCVYDECKVFFGTSCGMFLLESKCDSVSLLPFGTEANGKQNPDITDIISFDSDEILVGTNGNGVFRYNVENHSVINITRYGSVSSSLSDDYIIRLFKDNSDRFWIATALGINKMVKEYENFMSFNLYNGSAHNLPVRSIDQITGNELIMGTDYGVFVFNKAKNSYTGFEDYYHIDNHKIALTRVSKVYYDRNRYLWIGTRYKGVFCYDTKNCVFLDWLPDFTNQMINDIVDDKHGGIWIATDGCLSRIDVGNKTYKRVYEGCARAIMCDGYCLYVTVDQGLMRRCVKNDYNEIYEVGGDNVLYNITKGNDGNLYCGSYLDGVVVFDVNTKKFSVLANEDDGVSPIAYKVLFDKNNNAWVTTNMGIWEYDMTTKMISRYNYADGLQGNDFTMNGAMIDSSGMMYLGGFNGFSVFDPLEIKPEKSVPRLMITDFHTATGRVLMTVRENDVLELKNDDNSFVIGFTAYNLNKINKIHYLYKLEGYDRRWSEVGSDNHRAEYRNIPAGTYTFSLVAANESNVRNEPFNITIVVKPKWDDTLSFKIFVALSIIIVVLLVVYLIVRKERKKIAHARQIDELEHKMFILKGKALQMQMNPHFLYNTLNSIQSFIITNDSLKASLYLSSFAKLMRKILNNASRDKITLVEELEVIRLYLDLEMLRLNNRFTYKIVVSPDIAISKIEIASMLLQPFVENAVIHGLAYKAEGGMLMVEVKSSGEDEITVVIEDNGIGRARAAQIRKELGKTEKSYATSITKQRLEILNEVSKGEYSVVIIDLYDEHEQACGTRVEIKMCYHD